MGELVGRFLEEGKTVFAYANNHYQNHSPSTLDRFLEIRRGGRDGGPRRLQYGLALPFGLDRVYGWISEAGYDGVEIMMDDRWDTHQEDYLRDLVERHGLPILALHPRCAAVPGDSIPKRRWCGSRGWQDGGAHCSGTSTPARQAAGALEGWSPTQGADQGVVVAVENMPQADGQACSVSGGRAATCPSTSRTW